MKLRYPLGPLGLALVGVSACGGPAAPSATAGAGAGGMATAGSSATGGANAGAPPATAGSTNTSGSGGVATGGSGTAGTTAAGSGGSATSGAGTSAGGNGSGGVAGVGGASAGSAGAGGGGDLPPLDECNGKASIDRITMWTATNGECTCTPVGNILTTEGADAVAKVEFMGADWHVVPVLITNQFGKTADLSAAPGIQLTYSASAALHVQVRSGSHWNGGDQWAADVPSTSGMKQTLFIPFEAAKWASLFGTPTWSLADALKEVQGLVFVGQGANTVTFYGLRMQGFTPTCP